MDIRLYKLSIKNFKGCKDTTLTLFGNNTTIRGDNGTGKTTLYDAFLWLLFNKNSSNQSDFEVKPLDETGTEIHFLETEVEAELAIDDNKLKIKKVMTENWVKPRGQELQEYKGNETTYFFDEVPVKLNVFKQKVALLIDEETFKLITNPLYFNDEKAFSWQKRRLKLFEVCGDLKDDDIIASSPKLAKLPEILDGKTVDDRKAIIKSSITKLNGEIESISPKINENKRLIPEVEIDYSETEKQLVMLKISLEGIDKLLSDASNVAVEYQKQQQYLYGLNKQLDAVKKGLDLEANTIMDLLNIDKRKLLNEKYNLENEIVRYQQSNDHSEKQTTKLEVDRKLLINEWKDLNESLRIITFSTFESSSDTTFVCPTCGQDLPEGDKEKKLLDMTAKFDRNKAENIKQIQIKLAANISSGKGIKSDLELYKFSIINSEGNIDVAKASLFDIGTRLSEIEIEVLKPSQVPDYSLDTEYTSIQKQITDLQTKLDKPVEDTASELRQERQTIQYHIDNYNASLNNRDVVSNAKSRIEELKQSEKELSVQKSKLEGHLFLIEEFIKIKANMLSDTINNRFKFVRFKLFDQLMNGGLVETCQTLVNTNGSWVPYSDANQGGKINAGLDIISSISEYYGVFAPIFIDGRESITQIIDMKAQVISLIVSEQDAVLRVEVEE